MTMLPTASRVPTLSVFSSSREKPSGTWSQRAIPPTWSPTMRTDTRDSPTPSPSQAMVSVVSRKMKR